MNLLPGKAALEREYLSGKSFQQLADKYGVTSGKTVYNTMVRRARAAGTPWPLKQGRPTAARDKARLMQTERWDSVTAIMVRAEIKELRQTYNVEVNEVIALSGVSATTVWEINSGVRQRIARRTAERIMGAIERIEERHRRAAGGKRAWEKRRAA